VAAVAMVDIKLAIRDDTEDVLWAVILVATVIRLVAE
jgi:hypothetical protein